MKTLYKLFLLGLISIPMAVSGQTKIIKGKVTAFNQYGIPGLEVRAKKSKSKALTDGEGRFSIEVKDKDVVIVRDPIFMPYEKRVGPDVEELSINLIYDDTGSNKRKAVARGYFQEEEIDYATRYLNRENNLYALFNDVYEAVEYALPEAQVVRNGTNTPGFILRGSTSLVGDNTALFLVNGGLVNDIAFVAPADIKRITKLSSSAASLYGARGANGIISIELFP